MDYAWTCACCGQSFDTLPMAYGFEAPLHWQSLSEAERVTRAKLNADLCVIDNAEHYVRGCLEVPVIGASDTLSWGVWVSVSQPSFKYILDHWDTPIPDDEPARFGWLCTWINGYPNPHGVKCDVHLRSGNLRPLIVLHRSDYPLAVEQRNGVTLERVKHFAANAHRD